MDKIINFLKKNNIYFEDFDTEKHIDFFIDDMNKGLIGEKSSLKMIPTYINFKNKIPSDKKIIAVDAGGTNIRYAELFFDKNNRPVINNLIKKTMPGSTDIIEQDEFFNILADDLKNFLSSSDKIGFCFSYPTEMFPDKDGKLIALSKEINVKNLTGKMIGAGLNKKIVKLGYEKKDIVLLNDTVSVLLSGLQNPQKKEYSTYIGFILGTGSNLCYIEKNKNIKKIPGLDAGKKQIINVEAGNFNRLPMSSFDNEVDKSSNDRGMQIFEKMVSGRYFGKLCYYALKKAVEEKIFLAHTNKTLQKLESLTTLEINNFLCNENSTSNVLENILKQGKTNDKTKIKYLLDCIVERNAKIAAAVLSAVILKINKDEKIDLPVCIACEGTTFYKLKGLKENIEKYLTRTLTVKHNIKYEIVNIPKAALVGAAIAGLLN